MSEKISNEQYDTAQEQVKLMAQLILDLPLAACIRRQSIASSIAPLAHPTLFMAARDRFRLVRRLTEAAREFQREVEAVNVELQDLGPPKYKRGDFGPGLWGPVNDV